MKEVIFAYDSWAEKYDEDEKFNIATQSDKDLLIPTLKPAKKDLILDYGCGTGRFTIQLAKKCKKIIGVDISDKMLNIAKAKSKKVKNLKFMKTKGSKKLPFKDETFDKIICALVTNHIKDIGPFLKEMKRVLKKGGVLVYDDFAMDIKKPFVGAIKTKLRELKDEGKIEYFFHSINQNIHAIHRLDFSIDSLQFTRMDERLKHTMTPETYKRNKGRTYSVIYRLTKN